MELKKIISAALLLGAISFSATTASARSGFEVTLNTALGATGLSCSACHVGGTSAASATTPMALTWKSSSLASNLANSDSDGDGYTNKQEVSGALLNFNTATVSPFTIKSAGAGVTDTALTSVVVIGTAGATAPAFTDPYTLATTGKEILGGVSVNIANTATLYFKAGAVDAASLVYTVDATGQGTAATMGTDWTVTVDGGLNILALPAGAVNASYVVVRSIPAAQILPAKDKASVVGCMTGSTLLPLMLFALLSLGFFVRRKS